MNGALGNLHNHWPGVNGSATSSSADAPLGAHSEFKQQGIKPMATFNAFYVRAVADDAAIAAAIRAKFLYAKVQAGTPFWTVILSDDEYVAPERELMQLSLLLKTDVLWLSFQSVVDAFQFHHWQAGEHLRSLVYGVMAERAWERAEGTPEPWEREVFFDPRELKELLEAMDECMESEGEKRETERIWRDAEIRPGQAEPGLIARECARKVAKYFHLPGWGPPSLLKPGV